MASSNLDKERTKELLKRLKPKWYELRYDEIRNKPYLIGKRTIDEEMHAVFSIDVRASMDFQGLKGVIQDSGQPNVTVAVHSNDSTNVFYNCQMGLKSPLAAKIESESTDSSGESSEN